MKIQICKWQLSPELTPYLTDNSNSPNQKIFAQDQIGSIFADGKSNDVVMNIPIFSRVENAVGQGQNVGY